MMRQQMSVTAVGDAALTFLNSDVQPRGQSEKLLPFLEVLAHYPHDVAEILEDIAWGTDSDADFSAAVRRRAVIALARYVWRPRVVTEALTALIEKTGIMPDEPHNAWSGNVFTHYALDAVPKGRPVPETSVKWEENSTYVFTMKREMRA